MNTNTLIIALIALVIGGSGGYLVAGSQAPNPDEHMMGNGMIMHNSQMGMGDAMSGMMLGLEGKIGDAFDRAFLSEMIMHHEGAVLMAEAALENAKHPEIKDMANAIISAQTTEIEQMKEWQSSWYGN